MKALWALEKATVHEVRAALLPDRPLAYTTVMTVMDRLAHKGVVERVKQGRAHLYRPSVSESAIRGRLLDRFVEDFFSGSYESLRKHLENGRSAKEQSGMSPPARTLRVRPAKPRVVNAPRIRAEIDPSLL